MSSRCILTVWLALFSGSKWTDKLAPDVSTSFTLWSQIQKATLGSSVADHVGNVHEALDSVSSTKANKRLTWSCCLFVSPLSSFPGLPLNGIMIAPLVLSVPKEKLSNWSWLLFYLLHVFCNQVLLTPPEMYASQHYIPPASHHIPLFFLNCYQKMFAVTEIWLYNSVENLLGDILTP